MPVTSYAGKVTAPSRHFSLPHPRVRIAGGAARSVIAEGTIDSVE